MAAGAHRSAPRLYARRIEGGRASTRAAHRRLSDAGVRACHKIGRSPAQAGLPSLSFPPSNQPPFDLSHKPLLT
jgi:hypothetical protein